MAFRWLERRGCGEPGSRFQFHHQPFTYYDNYAAGTIGRAMHLRDEDRLLGHLTSVTCPP